MSAPKAPATAVCNVSHSYKKAYFLVVAISLGFLTGAVRIHVNFFEKLRFWKIFEKFLQKHLTSLGWFQVKCFSFVTIKKYTFL